MVNIIDKFGFHITNTAHAAGVDVGLCIPVDIKDAAGKVTGTSCVSNFNYAEYIHAIYGYSLKIGGVLTVLMIIYAGYAYMTSQGDNSKINTAKDIFMGTLLGFTLLLTLGLILDFLGLPTFSI